MHATPASHLSLVALAELFRASFAGYSVPLDVTAESLARRIRREGIDLHKSVVLEDEDQPVGMALLAIRGERHWVGGFGVIASHRGRGLAHALWDALLAQVDGSLSLEVLASNHVALQFYLKKGMLKTRDLLILEHDKPASKPATSADAIELILKGQRNWPPPWQRDIPALLSLRGLRGYGDRQTWIVIDDSNTIVDTGASDPEAATALLSTLPGPLRLVNEPEQSPFAGLLREVNRQRELTLPSAKDL